MVLRDFTDLPVVFLVYTNEMQKGKYIRKLLWVDAHFKETPAWNIIWIKSRYEIIELRCDRKFNHFIELEEYLNNNIRKSAKLDSGALNTLLMIDDLFNLKLFYKKNDANFFLKLLEKAGEHHIFLLIGTSSLYRGLLNSFMGIANVRSLPDLNSGFSELVINEDDLFFFREKGSGTFIRYF
jgi:hypothetical protein